MRYTFKQAKTIANQPVDTLNRPTTVENAVKYTDRTMAFNETQIWFPSN